MAYAYALDPAIPAGGESAALGDDRIREFKNAVIERVGSFFTGIDVDPWVAKSPVVGGNVQNVIPAADNTYSLGTGALRFADLHSVLATLTTLTVTTANATSVVSVDVSASNSFVLAPAKKLFYDGGGDSYIFESAANILDTVAGGSTMLRVEVNRVNVFGDFIVPALQKLFLDGVTGAGGDTYLIESAANTLDGYAGAAQVTRTLSTGFGVAPTCHLFLDNGGDTYLIETAANTIDVFAGGVSRMTIAATVTMAAATITAMTGTLQTAAQPNITSVGSLTSLTVTGALAAGSLTVTGGFGVTSTNHLWLDGGGDTYLLETSANVLDILAGGITQLHMSDAGIALGEATKKLAFFNTASVAPGVVQQTITGSRAGNAALASLLTALALHGLCINSTSA